MEVLARLFNDVGITAYTTAALVVVVGWVGFLLRQLIINDLKHIIDTLERVATSLERIEQRLDDVWDKVK